jgi:hypothetical protein
MDELQVGDYIENYDNKYFPTASINMVSKITKSYIFVKQVYTNNDFTENDNLLATSRNNKWTYYYNYVNIYEENYLSTYEARFKIKDTNVRKAIDNFIIISNSQIVF